MIKELKEKADFDKILPTRDGKAAVGKFLITVGYQKIS